jgi:cytochrome b subunit of formate dehydrogenase
MRGFCFIAAVLVSWVNAQAVSVDQTQIDNRRCFACHAQSQIGELGFDKRRAMIDPGSIKIEESDHPRPELHIVQETLAQSVHAALACVDCHADAKTLPHPQKMTSVSCGSANCHGTAGSDYLQGAHAEAAARGDAKAPTCATCHGGHDILPKSNRNSRVFPLNIVKICGDCHEKHISPDGRDGAYKVQEYLDSVHGRAVTKGGLAVAATCADCHSNHRVLPAKDERSTVNRSNISATCGKCHTGVSEVFLTSIHGQKLTEGDPKAPVCNDCHTAHSITRIDSPSFKLDIVKECGTCHDQPRPGSTSKLTLYDTYRMSYHGQATGLGFTRAARCSDCHGAHDIRRVDDPASRLSAENKLHTCQQCHKEAGPKFAMFSAHADFHDGQRYPLLHGIWLYFVIMMSCAFGFFGLHSIFWFFRSLIERIKHGPRAKHAANGTAIKRFNRVDRINHAFVIISFFGLTLTGLPLLYADKKWGKKLAGVLGGVNFAGYLHRFFAIMLIANFVVHFVGLARRFKSLGVKQMLFGPVTMLPRPKDLFDCVGMWRWFFKGGSKPKFDRWTYWEKFDYVAEVGGSFIIGITGLFLWFPVYFSQYLPGWMFNVATVVHGYEALLAIGFIFTIHFFNAHLRIEKFPVDDVMFSGSLPEEEFKEERGAEYERLVAQGKLEALRVKAPSKWYRVFAVCMGLIAMAIGTTLVVLIILAGLKWI